MEEIHFVTGKGGVGKSVVAAALALNYSRQGKKVLLVELGDQSFYRDYFSLPEVGFHPRPLRENLSIAQWTGEAALREYAAYLIKVESLVKLFFENSVMKAFINVAPALPELAILGKITSGPRKHGPVLPFDVLVVDAFSTGHFMALMEAPRGMARAISMGPMGEQSRSIEALVRNPEICKYHVVTLPEELPFKEAQELIENLKGEFGIESHLILNKVLSVPVSETSLQAVQSQAGDLARFAQYLLQQKSQQEHILQAAKDLYPQAKTVPLIFESDEWKLVEAVAEGLR